MDVRPYIRRYCPSMEELARQAGLSYPYVKHLARERPRAAGKQARVLLADAFRRQARQLEEDAAALMKGVVD